MEPANNPNQSGFFGMVQMLLEPVFSGFLCLLFSVLSLYDYIGYRRGEARQNYKNFSYIFPDERLKIAMTTGIIALVLGMFCLFGLWTVYKPMKPVSKPPRRYPPLRKRRKQRRQ